MKFEERGGGEGAGGELKDGGGGKKGQRLKRGI